MALSVPTSTQWVTFPTRPADAVVIRWKEGVERSWVYYVTKCYWGVFERNIAESSKDEIKQWPQTSTGKATVSAQGAKGLDILGESRLYIAAEYVEPHYRGGPLEDFHILSLLSKQTEKSEWLTLQLNELFRYGQHGSAGNLKRWLVWHPPISRYIPAPNIFQHRFTGSTAADLIKAAAAELPSKVPQEYTALAKAAGTLASLGTDVVRTAVGHELHPFLSSDGLATAAKVAAKVKTTVTAEGQAKNLAENPGATTLADTDKSKGNLVIPSAGTATKAQGKSAQLSTKAADALAKNATKNATHLDEFTKRLIALQFTESVMAQAQNKKTDRHAAERLRQETTMLKRLEAGEKKNTGLIAKIKAVITGKGKYAQVEETEEEVIQDMDDLGFDADPIVRAMVEATIHDSGVAKDEIDALLLETEKALGLSAHQKLGTSNAYVHSAGTDPNVGHSLPTPSADEILPQSLDSPPSDNKRKSLLKQNDPAGTSVLETKPVRPVTDPLVTKSPKSSILKQTQPAPAQQDDGTIRRETQPIPKKGVVLPPRSGFYQRDKSDHQPSKTLVSAGEQVVKPNPLSRNDPTA